MKIDLHTHTHHSDGLLSPAELVMRAANMQVDVLAITDHDTVAGVNEAQQAVEDAKVSMKIVPGIELSTRWRGFDIHILGLNLDHQCPQLLQRLTIQHQYRIQRAEQIDAKLQKAGIHGVLTRAQELAGVGQVTRAHFARAMVEMQLVNDMQAAFKRYLGKGQRAFVTPQWITVEEAIHWIRDAGGKAVLAHPTHYDLSAKWIRRLTAEFCQHGGEG